VVGGIVAVNVLVFALWKAPGVLPRVWQQLTRHAVHHPLAGRGLPLLACTFSHQEATHLVFNMYALSTFAPALAASMGPSTFLAFYLTAGTAASLGGMAVKLAQGSTAGSLGAHVLRSWLPFLAYKAVSPVRNAQVSSRFRRMSIC
jgi:membrane associated rhomboid family serine protease